MTCPVRGCLVVMYTRGKPIRIRPSLNCSVTPIERSIMAVKIKLTRFGKIRNPQYRAAVADARIRRDGRATR